MENFDEILKYFGFTPSSKVEHLRQHHNSTWTIDNEYILKQNSDKDQGQAEKAIAVSKFLRGEGIPVAEYLTANTGSGFVASDGCVYTVMRKLNGKHIEAFSGDFIERARNTGVEVARLHKALKNFSGIDVHDSYLIDELKNWVSPAIESANITIPNAIMGECLNFAEEYSSLPRQIIHRDIQYGNILFEDNRLSGFLDFDSLQKNVRIFDVVYFLQAVLVDNYHDNRFIKLWREFADSFLLGYHSESKLCASEVSAFYRMALSIQLIFIAWFASKEPNFIAKSVKMAEWVYSNKDVFDFNVKGT